jgi:hypothetical protein
MDPILARFCLHHPEMIVLPIEELGPAGCSEALAALLVASGRVDTAWVARFDACFARYVARTNELYAKAPESWPAARIQHVCLVTEPERTRPYYQPLEGASWLLYASDFDPASGSVELGAYLIALAERAGLVKKLSGSVLRTLSWFVGASDEAVEDFREGAGRSVRPDAPAFVHLAEQLGIVRAFSHDSLAPNPEASGPAFGRVDGTGLVIDKRRIPVLKGIMTAFDEAGGQVVERYFARQAVRSERAAEATDALVAWLAREVPPVLLLDGPERRTLWDPERPHEAHALREALAGAGDAPVESLHADLALVSARTRGFLAALDDPGSLAVPTESLEEAGGVYIHPRKLVAYALEQPGIDVRAEAAPPFHRLLLAARVTHEWGHLAVEAGYVPVAPELATEKKARFEALRACFDRIVRAAPAEQEEQLREDQRLLARQGRHFADVVQDRVDDYRANLLMRALCPSEETEAYLRANVRALLFAPGGPYQRLARYAYEFQYLRIGCIADPWRYFVASSFFREQYLSTGIVTEPLARELFERVSALFECYRIDRARVRSSTKDALTA